MSVFSSYLVKDKDGNAINERADNLTAAVDRVTQIYRQGGRAYWEKECGAFDSLFERKAL